uniref:cyclic AMP-responsive element-binding protein 1-like isoform X1 n=1 Tax=Myxine glutinosa TaxID=7769 RepID=UPI00358E6C62
MTESQQENSVHQVSLASGNVVPTMAVVQLPGGQTLQVHSVIQAAQPSSVIQTPQMQTIQVGSLAESDTSQESGDSTSDTQKRRELLSRRPSYRKILSDLSSDSPVVSKIEEEKGEEEGTTTINSVPISTPIYQTTGGQYIAITQGGGAIQIANGAEHLQSLGLASSGTSHGTPTIVQYAQTSDGQQFFLPGGQVVVQASGDTYQIRTPTGGLSQGVVVASPASLPSPQGGAEEATRKREMRLLKNRVAAKECRRRKKEYIRCLENRVAVLETQNKQLLEELKELKELYCGKGDSARSQIQ